MKKHITQFFLAVILYVATCLLTIFIIKPFSILIFIGSAAGITSAIILLWGTHLIAAIVAASLLLNVILCYYFSVAFNLPIFIITTLAICLQGFCVKRLAYKVIAAQSWLDSRAMLISFLLKVGPLASLISASTSVLISALYVREFDTNLFFVFCRTWSTSTLISVFAIPILLFLQGKQLLNSGKRFFVIISSILGGLSIALLFKIFQDQHQHYRADEFYDGSTFVKSELRNEITQIERQLNAVKAYFETSNLITLDNFNEFSAYIMEDFSSIEAIEWVPIVQHDKRKAYEEYVSELLDYDYQISKQTLSGDKVAHPNANIYMPVQYVFPRYQNEKILGTNVYSEINKKHAIEQAVSTSKPSATIPISFVEGDFTNPVINVVLPVYSKELEPYFGEYKNQDNQVITGVIIGVIKVSKLFSRITHYIENNNITFTVTGLDNTVPFNVYGENVEGHNRLVENDKTIVYSREWNYIIAEKEPWVLQTKKWQTWAMLFGGTFGGFIFQMLILMMAAYSTELSFRVSKQTRELILSKEKSDKENQAKTQFLQSLSFELRTPLSVISKLIEVFPIKHLGNNEKEYINNISNAALNLEQLIDTLNELSTVESGNLVLNKQSFDFVLFLNRMEDITNAQDKNIQFTIQKDVPQFIKTDELRLQQVFISCVENACGILTDSNLSVSVKVHFHKQNNATIVFVITPIIYNHDNDTGDQLNRNNVKDDLSHFNLKMTMAKELSNKLGGNITVAKLPSGQAVINVSIKVTITQDREYVFGRFNKLKASGNKDQLMLKRILYVEAKNEENINFYRQLSTLDYNVSVKKPDDEINMVMNSYNYSLVVYDCSDMENKLNEIKLLREDNLSTVPTLGIFNHPLSDSMLTLVHHKFSFYLVLPIETYNLNKLLNKYIN